jgi:hypothetical protein
VICEVDFVFIVPSAVFTKSAKRISSLLAPLIEMMRVPSCAPISAVASADASSTTVISYDWATPDAAARIAAMVDELCFFVVGRNDKRNHFCFGLGSIGVGNSNKISTS